MCGSKTSDVFWIAALALTLVLAACSAPEPTPDVTPVPPATTIPAPIPPTATPTATATPAPTATPEPSPTPTPTPTPTVIPSLTPSPTPDPLILLEEFNRLNAEADALYYAGDCEGAIEIYDQMLALEIGEHGDELMATAYGNRAGCYSDLKEYAAAIPDYEMAVALGMVESDILNNLCWSYALIGEPENGLAYCDQAIELEYEAAYIDSRAVARGLAGDLEGAAADLEALLDLLAPTTDVMLREIRAERRVWLAILQGDESPFIPAVMERLRADDTWARLEGEEVEASAHLTALSSFMEGRALFNRNRFEESIKAYSEAITLYPEFQEAYYFRGIAYRYVEQPELALADYDQAIALESQDAPAYHLRGLTHGTLGDFAQAVADYTAAIEIDPFEVEYYASRGVDYLSLGQPAEALADLDHALELDPLNTMVLFYRGLTYAAIGEIEAAVTDLELALEIGVPPNLEDYIRGLLDELQP